MNMWDKHEGSTVHCDVTSRGHSDWIVGIGREGGTLLNYIVLRNAFIYHIELRLNLNK